MSYQFRALERGDFPLIRRWLASPHIGGWWGDADTEIALMEQDMDTGATDMRIVSHEGQAFAYVQDYDAHEWPAPQYADQPKGARAMDTFLGDASMLGKGHGAAYIKERAMGLLARGFPRVLVDPDPENTRAVNAYRRAGFVPLDIRPCEDGDPVLVMEFKGGASTEGHEE